MNGYVDSFLSGVCAALGKLILKWDIRYYIAKYFLYIRNLKYAHLTV